MSHSNKSKFSFQEIKTVDEKSGLENIKKHFLSVLF